MTEKEYDKDKVLPCRQRSEGPNSTLIKCPPTLCEYEMLYISANYSINKSGKTNKDEVKF